MRCCLTMTGTMRIQEVITKHWSQLSGACQDRVICSSKTEADVVQDVMLTALNKYKNGDVDEAEALEYLKKTLQTEKYFSYKRIVNEKLVYFEDILLEDRKGGLN